MKRAQAQALQREITHLRDLIARTPKNGPIGDGGLSARLGAVRNELAALDVTERDAIVELTFRGEPVVGDTAIAGEFGGRALSTFTRLVDTALELFFPGESASGLYVTAPARGSFGFRLEELANSETSTSVSALSRAVEKSTELLSQAASDPSFDVDAKLLGPLKSFVTVVRKGGATVRLHSSTCDRQLDTAALDRAAERIRDLQSATVSESTQHVEGTLTGLRLGERDFEHTRTDGTRIVGGLGPDLDLELARELFGQVCIATVLVVVKDFSHRSRPSRRTETLLSVMKKSTASPAADSGKSSADCR